MGDGEEWVGDVYLVEGWESVGPPVEVKEFALYFWCVSPSDDFSGDACDDGEGGYVFGDDGVGAEDGTVSDG